MTAKLTACSATIILSFSLGAFAQSAAQISKAKALLGEAARLVPEIEELQQSSLASNIAREQVLAGDLAAALETVHSVKRSPDSTSVRGLEYVGIVWSLARKGNLQLAMNLLHDLPDGDPKAVDYQQLAQSLAANNDFEHAMAAPRSIRAIPKAVSRFADALLAVSNRQFGAGEAAAAATTLQEALDAVESDQEGFDAAFWYPGAIRQLMSAGNASAASSLLERLSTAAAEEKGFRP